MKLTKKEKQALSNLLLAGRLLSNGAFNLGQLVVDENYRDSCKEACRRWDKAYAEAKPAIRKLQLPPF